MTTKQALAGLWYPFMMCVSDSAMRERGIRTLRYVYVPYPRSGRTLLSLSQFRIHKGSPTKTYLYLLVLLGAQCPAQYSGTT